MGALKKGSLQCRTFDFSKLPAKIGVSWEPKEWRGYTRVNGIDIWSDGTNIYYSSFDKHYILSGDTWEPKVWGGELTSFQGKYIWTDGANTYYSCRSEQYVLNGDTFEPKVWKGLTDFTCDKIWSDGTNIYYFYVDSYVLNGDTWVEEERSAYIWGDGMWSDGINIYNSASSTIQYVLNGDTWEGTTWNGYQPYSGECIWSDGINIYYSDNSIQYILNGDTWEAKEWNHYFGGSYLWSDGTNIYYSSYNASLGERHYVLRTIDPPKPVPFIPDPLSMTMGWLVGRQIAGMR